jgi:hypothetical protein
MPAELFVCGVGRPNDSHVSAGEMKTAHTAVVIALLLVALAVLASFLRWHHAGPILAGASHNDPSWGKSGDRETDGMFSVACGSGRVCDESSRSARSMRNKYFSGQCDRNLLTYNPPGAKMKT